MDMNSWRKGEKKIFLNAIEPKSSNELWDDIRDRSFYLKNSNRFCCSPADAAKNDVKNQWPCVILPQKK
jgi:hypothetical protein